MNVKQIKAEQELCLKLKRSGLSREQICQQLNLSLDQVKRRLKSAYKHECLDPELARRLNDKGIVDLAGLHSGWLLEKNKKGSGSSLYFYLGPDQEKISFADAMRDVLSEIPVLPPLQSPKIDKDGRDWATWLFLADLHVGGSYGDPRYEELYNEKLDGLFARMPPAEHCVIMELGDLMDANDHKGITPHSGNPMDVKRDDHLTNTKTAVRFIRRAVLRGLETHETVEVHIIPGNHDPSAYVGVLLTLEAQFADNPRVKIVVTDEEFRTVEWGLCGCFPHHGDTIKWSDLKDVWADQYVSSWHQAQGMRLIATAHFHHDRMKDLVGATGRQFRTIHGPNKWAKSRGFFSRGTLTALTVHKEAFEEHETKVHIRPLLRDLVK